AVALVQHQGRGLSFELGGKRTSLLAHQTPLSRRGFSPKSVSGISRPLHCNHAVQVYSKGALFYRSERPNLIEAFTSGTHLIYEHPDNPMDNLIRSIPGIPPRDRSLDFLRDLRRGKASQ
ncbi:hypothetical protein, partial [Pseudomonas aeruginosa]